MNRSQIEAALERNVPFTLCMADGKAYHVPYRDYLSLPPKGAFLVVYDDQQHVFVLPLITMTGLTYQSEWAESKGPPASQRVACNRFNAQNQVRVVQGRV
jgi:hypothetical protein